MIDREEVWNVIKKMDLVQSVTVNGQIKQAGEDIKFSKIEDEFTSHLTRLIPAMLCWLGKVANTGDPESLELIRQDLKEWVNQQESLLGIYLEDSAFKSLVEPAGDEATDGGDQ